MKQLILVRHAKSGYDLHIQNDLERSLNERGHHDAGVMGKRLFQRHLKIDAFISSPAKRAVSTAACFAEAFHFKENKIIKEPGLYNAFSFTFFQIVEKLDDKLNTVVFFGHNPGITDFASQLTSTRIDHMSTCSIFAVEANIEHWADFEKHNKTFLFFDTPKETEVKSGMIKK